MQLISEGCGGNVMIVHSAYFQLTLCKMGYCYNCKLIETNEQPLFQTSRVLFPSPVSQNWIVLPAESFQLLQIKVFISDRKFTKPGWHTFFPHSLEPKQNTYMNSKHNPVWIYIYIDFPHCPDYYDANHAYSIFLFK